MFLLALTVQVSAKESPYRIELKMLYPQTTDSWNYSDDSLDVSSLLLKVLTPTIFGQICNLS